MTTDREVRDALVKLLSDVWFSMTECTYPTRAIRDRADEVRERVEALRSTLSQPAGEQEAVAIVRILDQEAVMRGVHMLCGDINDGDILYATPPSAQDVRRQAMEATHSDVVTVPREDAGLWYLQDSRATVGNCALWWREGGNGYTTNLHEAAKFTKADAERAHKSRSSDVAWPVSYVDKLSAPRVDFQYLNLDAALTDAKDKP